MRRTRSLTRGKEAHDGVLCRARCTAANPPSTREVRVGSNATELGRSAVSTSTISAVSQYSVTLTAWRPRISKIQQ
jgi:hypothetical protein